MSERDNRPSTTSIASCSTRSSGTSRSTPTRTPRSPSGSAPPKTTCTPVSPASRMPASSASCRRSSTPARSATARRSSPPRSTPTTSTTPRPVISEHPGVSHNYKRNHAYNLWYTLAVPPGASLDDHLDVLHRDVGLARHPQAPDAAALQDRREARHDGQTAADARTEVLEHERPERRPDMVAPVLSDRGGRGDPRRAGGPPARPAAVRGAGGADRHSARTSCSTLLASFKERKLMRRFAAVMNHRSAGFKANAMGVWAVPDDELGEIGPRMAGFALVSHCYRRPDLRGLAVLGVHDGARQERARVRGDHRRDPGRDRRRRVRAALVGQGVQEDAA